MTSERKVRWIVRLGAGALRALAATWRMRSHNRGGLDAARASNQRIIFALWHGELLPLLWQHRDDNVCIVISDHSDGEIVARVAASLRYSTVRGSSSKGGSRALIGLIREIDGGRDGAITPDGPRGPSRVFAPGAAVAAHRTGALIVPIRAKASRSWRLKSWDKFLIPKPFSVVDVSYGDPIRVVAESPRAAAEQCANLERLLNAVAGS